MRVWNCKSVSVEDNELMDVLFIDAREFSFFTVSSFVSSLDGACVQESKKIVINRLTVTVNNSQSSCSDACMSLVSGLAFCPARSFVLCLLNRLTAQQQQQ